MYSLNRNRFETEFRETDTVHCHIKFNFKESMVTAEYHYKHTTRSNESSSERGRGNGVRSVVLNLNLGELLGPGTSR